MNTSLIPEISTEEYELIKKSITNSQSPFAFDPLQTHIIIIHKLTDIQKRLEKLENQMK
jgi:hypothetical protein